MSLDISPAQANAWIDVIANFVAQPISVILIVVVSLQWYALYHLGGSYITQGIRITRIRLLYAFKIMEQEKVTLKEAEEKADHIIYKGRIPHEGES